MPEESEDRQLTIDRVVQGPELVGFLRDEPDSPYPVYARNSDGPLCRMPFTQLAAFVPESIEASGWVCDGKVWAFFIAEDADRVADCLSDDGGFSRQHASRICRLCGGIKLLSEFERFVWVCHVCSEKRRIAASEQSGDARRAREARGGELHTEQQWQDLLAANGRRCLRCGSVEDLTRDHVIPLVHGGSNGIENIQPLCRRCNSWKHTRIIDFRANLSPTHPGLHREVEIPGSDPRAEL